MRRMIIALAFLLVSSAVRAELVIEITSGVDNPTPIAIVQTGWSGGSALPEDVAEVVMADLRRSGQFRPIPHGDMLSSPSRASEVYYRDWRILKAEYLVISNLTTNASGGYHLEFEMFDVFNERKMLDLAVDGGPEQLRDLAHYMSDQIYERITGIRGIFSTSIAYVEEIDNVYRLMMADADGARPRLLKESRPGEPLLSPSWSPDGRYLAYVSFETTRPAIYIQEVATGERRQVTDFKGLNGAPAWSPDSQKLALTLSKDGNPEIYTLDINTRELRRVTNHYAIDHEPSWTADGKAILFTSNRGAKPQIYQVTLASGRPERLTFVGPYNAKPVVSPDGSGFVFIHRDERGNDHIALQEFETGNIRVLTQTQVGLDESPTVAPNGAMLMYATKNRQGKGILAAVSMDAATAFDLPSKQGDVREPAWSPFRD
ncbi:Tol-Pal system beta propeller repeat protein TolB [Gilvimarinus sp. F26214L]|uniref:Tol-Pal system beta propeller repeat protein TolB n=1 Tax=Gilvimarinus sp. DZF01 TaxID=3461371 RepID=UPI00404646A4